MCAKAYNEYITSLRYMNEDVINVSVKVQCDIFLLIQCDFDCIIHGHSFTSDHQTYLNGYHYN